MRPPWDEYFMDMAHLVSSRSTCNRRKVGAVITRWNRVLETGYNGAPEGLPHCNEQTDLCERARLKIPSGERLDLCRALHAEQNAILQAAKEGRRIEGADLYVTISPCYACAKMIINAGIYRVIYEGSYADEKALDILQKGQVRVKAFVRER